MQCNIDRRGRTVRIVVGAIFELIGLGLFVLWYFGGPEWMVWPAIGCVLGGNFAMFEGAIGWCAVRAMGFRTPL
jgi:hypothetical protein